MTPEEHAIQVWEGEGGFIDLSFDEEDADLDVASNLPPAVLEINA